MSDGDCGRVLIRNRGLKEVVVLGGNLRDGMRVHMELLVLGLTLVPIWFSSSEFAWAVQRFVKRSVGWQLL